MKQSDLTLPAVDPIHYGVVQELDYDKVGVVVLCLFHAFEQHRFGVVDDRHVYYVFKWPKDLLVDIVCL